MTVALVEKVPSLQQARTSGPALFLWRRSVRLNRVTFARLANVSERTLATYEKQKQFPAQIRSQMSEALRLVKALREIIPDEDLKVWLKKPNPGFGGRKPWSLITSGERDLIWKMIHQTQQGAFA
jgi:DNA-binding transcriptional regulator YiaG